MIETFNGTKKNAFAPSAYGPYKVCFLFETPEIRIQFDRLTESKLLQVMSPKTPAKAKPKNVVPTTSIATPVEEPLPQPEGPPAEQGPADELSPAPQRSRVPRRETDLVARLFPEGEAGGDPSARVYPELARPPTFAGAVPVPQDYVDEGTRLVGTITQVPLGGTPGPTQGADSNEPSPERAAREDLPEEASNAQIVLKLVTEVKETRKQLTSAQVELSEAKLSMKKRAVVTRLNS